MKKSCLAISLLLCLAGFALVILFFGRPLWKWIQPGPDPSAGVIASQGGEPLNVFPDDAGSHYRQGDPRWGDDEIGGSRETIGRVGCTLASVAMAASDLGYPIDPGELNRRLIERSGYTEKGWLIWAQVAPSTENTVEVAIYNEPDFKVIDAALERGEIPIVKFFLPNNWPHWVAIVGKDGDDYLIKDPASKRAEIVTLSSRTRSIFSLRIVRKQQS